MPFSRLKVVILSLLGGAAYSQEGTFYQDAEIRSDISFDMQEPWLTGDDDLLWGDNFHVSSDYVRMKFEVNVIDPGLEASIHIFTAKDKDGLTIELAEKKAGEAFWSPSIEGSPIQVELRSASVPTNTHISVREVLYSLDTIADVLGTTGGRDDKVDIGHKSVPDAIMEAGTAVGMIRFIDGGLGGACSGFLISDNEFITNQHCISKSSICSSIEVTFGYAKRDSFSKGEKFFCEHIDEAKIDFDVDIAVVELAGNPGRKYGSFASSFEDLPTSLNDRDELVVIQHPNRKPMKVSIIGCSAEDLRVTGHVSGTSFTHKCDTEKGSSGGPVLKLDGTLVGVHHYGFNESSWGKNRAVHFDLIQTRF